MRTSIIYLLAFGLMAGLCLALVTMATPPDRLILGGWEQTGWAYEKVDKAPDTEETQLLDEVTRSVGKGLVLHRAETWEFMPGNTLRLINGDAVEEVRWNLKGRGHLLHITHANGSVEHFILERIDQDSMRLQFETEIQARGIARLEFKRPAISS